MSAYKVGLEVRRTVLRKGCGCYNSQDSMFDLWVHDRSEDAPVGPPKTKRFGESFAKLSGHNLGGKKNPHEKVGRKLGT